MTMVPRSVVHEDVVVGVEEAVVVVVVAVVAVEEEGSKTPLLFGRGRRRINLVGRIIIVDSRGLRRLRGVVVYLDKPGLTRCDMNM